MLCPTTFAPVDTSTRMHKENTLRQFNYSLPIGMNVMGNWVPITLTVLMTPVSGYEAIVTPVPDTNCWFYEENSFNISCTTVITSWEYFFEQVQDVCDQYRDSNGTLHKPTFTKLHDNEVPLIEFTNNRTCYSGKRYYKAAQTLLPDGSFCRPECSGGFSDDYTIDTATEKKNEKQTAERKVTVSYNRELPVMPASLSSRLATAKSVKVNRATRRTKGCSTCGRH